MTSDQQAASHSRYRDRVADAVKATIAFFADDNRGVRYLVRHQSRADGRCQECLHTWPCSLIEMAKAGVEMATKRALRADGPARGAT